MLEYKVSPGQTSRHILHIELHFEAHLENTIVQIPFWRPGRYQGGNFPKDYLNFKATADEKALKARKVTSHTWNVEAIPGQKVKLSYDYYAAELTAGNTYYDSDLLLINPVNSFAYIKGMEDYTCRVHLAVDPAWKLATAMEREQEDANEFYADGVQQLLDTPILAAPQLETIQYQVQGVDFYMDIYGDGVADRDKLKEQFRDFTEVQLRAFGDFPVKSYRFLLLFMPHKTYHGVEHESSTVIVLGPDKELDEPSYYEALMGVSSHELYHTWNVKHLRPSTWMPYDFTGPGPSRLGYVAEGVTTYMGDWMLWQSGFFSDEQFFAKLSLLLKRHIANEGRFNLSLGDSSIDTWIDGYGRGTPRRRQGIYVEGALVALTCDLWLMEATNGETGLCDVMRLLNQKLGGTKGYNEGEYWSTMKSSAPELPWNDLIDELIDGRGNIESYTEGALEKAGLEIERKASANPWERDFGVKLLQKDDKIIAWNVLSGSPAESAGLWFDDILETINGQDAAKYYYENESTLPDEIQLKVKSGFRNKDITLRADGNERFVNPIVRLKSPNALFESWKTFLKKETDKA
jgi:predicted metalloprotease with PDZ domain